MATSAPEVLQMGGRDGQLNVPQAHIAQGHRQDVQEGNGQISPDYLPGDVHPIDEYFKGGVQAHDKTDGSCHLQVRMPVVRVPTADLRKQIGAAPAQQGDDGKPKPIHFKYLSRSIYIVVYRGAEFKFSLQSAASEALGRSGSYGRYRETGDTPSGPERFIW